MLFNFAVSQRDWK